MSHTHGSKMAAALRAVSTRFCIVGMAFVAIAGTGAPTLASGGVTVPVEIRAPEGLIDLLNAGEESAPGLGALRRAWELAESTYRAGMDGVSGVSASIEAPFNVESPLPDGTGENGVGVQLHVIKPLTPASSVDLSVGTGAGWSSEEGHLAVAPVVGVSVIHLLGEGDNPVRKRLEYELRVARHAHTEGRRDWVGDVLDAYAELDRAVRAERTANLRTQLAAVRLEATEKRRQAGDSSAIDLEEAEARAGDARDALTLAHIAVSDARQAVGLLTGVDPRERMRDSDDEWAGVLRVDQKSMETGDLHDWVSRALSTRTEPRLADARVRLAELELAYDRRQTGWTGKLGAGITLPDSDVDIASWADTSPEWHVGASLSFPLIDGGQSEQVVQAELKLQDATVSARLVDRQIEAEVRATLLKVNAARRRLVRVEGRRDRATRLVEAAEESRTAGLNTEATVLAAKVALLEAEGAVAEAKLGVLKETVRLWQTIGRDLTW